MTLSQELTRLDSLFFDTAPIIYYSIQLASALTIRAEAFLTNDGKLKQVTEIEVLVLKDYL